MRHLAVMLALAAASPIIEPVHPAILILDDPPPDPALTQRVRRLMRDSWLHSTDFDYCSLGALAPGPRVPAHCRGSDAKAGVQANKRRRGWN